MLISTCRRAKPHTLILGDFHLLSIIREFRKMTSLQLANCQSDLLDVRYFPNVEADHWAADFLKSQVFHSIGFDSVCSLVRRVVQFDNSFHREIRIAYDKVHVFSADYVELRLPRWVFTYPYQCVHCNLNENKLVGQGFLQSVKQDLFWFAENGFSKVWGRFWGIFWGGSFYGAAFISRSVSLLHFYEDGNTKNHQNEKNQSFHWLSLFRNKSGDSKP